MYRSIVFHWNINSISVKSIKFMGLGLKSHHGNEIQEYIIQITITLGLKFSFRDLRIKIADLKCCFPGFNAFIPC